MHISTLFGSALVVLASFVSSEQCVKEDTRYVGRVAKMEQVFVDGNMTISGFAKIVDGCTFSVENFTFLPGSNDTVWYGRKDGDYNIGQRISTESFVSYNESEQVEFTLSSNVSLYDFDTMVLYSREYEVQMAYAKFDFPRPRSSSTVSVATSTASATVTPTPTPTPTPPTGTSNSTTDSSTSGAYTTGVGPNMWAVMVVAGTMLFLL